MPAIPNFPAVPSDRNHAVLLIDAKEVARLIGLSERTIWRLNRSGKLPKPISIGGKSKKWRADEITAWVAAGCPLRSDWDASLNQIG